MVRGKKTSPKLSSGSSASDSKEGDQEYEVNEIVSHRVDADGKIVYTISWVGYPNPADNTEACEENLGSCEMILNKYKEENGVGRKYTSASATKRSSRKVNNHSLTVSESGSTAASDAVTSDSDDGSASVVSLRRTPRRKATRASSSTRPTRSSQRTPSVVERTPSPKKETLPSSSTNRTTKRHHEETPEEEFPKKKTPASIARSALLSSESPEPTANSTTIARTGNLVNSNSPITEATKDCGLFNHLEVEQVSQIKSLGDGNVAVKVVYKNAPAPFKKSEYIDVRFIRHFAPQKLIDHLLSLVTADYP